MNSHALFVLGSLVADLSFAWLWKLASTTHCNLSILSSRVVNIICFRIIGM